MLEGLSLGFSDKARVRLSALVFSFSGSTGDAQINLLGETDV